MQDKVTLVTGGASGIGEGIVRKFIKEGAYVCIADMNIDAAELLAKEMGSNAFAIKMNVADENSVDQGINKVVERFGRLDCLVSNAGIQYISSIVDLSFEKWKQMISVNLDGAFLTTRAAMRTMIDKGNAGSIIYMGSTHSWTASPLKAPYVCAKHALVGLSHVVAKEGAKHGIRSNVVCPGFVLTPLVEKQIPEQAEKLGISEEDVIKKVMLKDTVDGEFSTIDDVANAVFHFASFPTNALTGQSLIVSHGWVLQ